MQLNKKLFTSAIAIAAISLSSFAANAGYIEYIPNGGWQATATVKYNNGGVRFTKSLESKSLLSITNKAKQIRSVEDDLRADIKAEILAGIAGKASLKGYNFKLNGPFKVKLKGLSNGTIEAQVGGFSIDAYAKVRKSWYAKGSIRIKSNIVMLSGHYDPNTGKINNLSLNNNFKTTVDVDVDSIFDLIPAFNWAFTNKLEDKLSNTVKNAIYNGLNDELSGYETVIFGLDSKIPNNKFVYNGHDYGRDIKDSFTDLVSNESITITVNKKRRYLDNPSVGYVSIGSVSINISNHLFLDVIDTPTIKTKWQAVCKHACEQEP